ncbi:MAG TPA: hypothetical protein DDX98_06140 [Bacteroidales bacterium]|jgi:Pyruvate/2-oxoacid:ferredoxin oxidoreductase delta subunit/branched-subunit amino acid transport protein AzlD|nr:hypothetical protein [Bacteroidales bacterium]
MPNALKIYYFSGTGNAKNVARWISEVAKEHRLSTCITDITSVPGRKPTAHAADDIVGFCAPTHGFNFPPVMMHFLLRIPRAKSEAFIVNTRAGLKMGKWFVPGLSGMAQYFYALVLKLKGYEITGMQSIDLPSNWISLHPGVKEKVADSLFLRCEKKSKQFAYKIFSGKKSLRALYDIVQDILITPISILYYFIGRYVFAKSFYADASCNNCNICMNTCPINAIKLVNKRPFWTHRCESCMHCMNSCPKRSIQTAHGYVIAILILISSVFLVRLRPYLLDVFNLKKSGLVFKSLDLVLQAIVTFTVFIITYYLFHFLLRIPVIRNIIYISSLTKYKFWRRYKIRNK